MLKLEQQHRQRLRKFVLQPMVASSGRRHPLRVRVAIHRVPSKVSRRRILGTRGRAGSRHLPAWRGQARHRGAGGQGRTAEKLGAHTLFSRAQLRQRGITLGQGANKAAALRRCAPCMRHLHQRLDGVGAVQQTRRERRVQQASQHHWVVQPVAQPAHGVSPAIHQVHHPRPLKRLREAVFVLEQNLNRFSRAMHQREPGPIRHFVTGGHFRNHALLHDQRLALRHRAPSRQHNRQGGLKIQRSSRNSEPDALHHLACARRGRSLRLARCVRQKQRARRQPRHLRVRALEIHRSRSARADSGQHKAMRLLACRARVRLSHLERAAVTPDIHQVACCQRLAGGNGCRIRAHANRHGRRADAPAGVQQQCFARVSAACRVVCAIEDRLVQHALGIQRHQSILVGSACAASQRLLLGQHARLVDNEFGSRCHSHTAFSLAAQNNRHVLPDANARRRERHAHTQTKP
nr:MAG TPA: hypothetical protein [Caudoviricetes sp.]